ncbi:hypothetical protein [Micromonospora cathayae]|uniref:Uncharacterized protein n=1 Tax=Micromonospora cathayae TaxID=3028804 RepID=A0ABY7ZNQ2_9ACTN|nr:hypothetical protein [Micromonospora sp. HUAS 3]WDZ84580.1 hypothetical protein PVK37_29800 [Micromonospora sp. HUAS 3]
MPVRKTAGPWQGDDFDDLATYIRHHQAGGYPVQHVKDVGCRHCDGKTFHVTVDDEEGCALITCHDCQTGTPIADSADYLEDADLEECACPCGGETFTVGVGYAMNTDNEVRWISLGLRCLTDGTLGVYTDWKIDYAPTAHLLSNA